MPIFFVKFVMLRCRDGEKADGMAFSRYCGESFLIPFVLENTGKRYLLY